MVNGLAETYNECEILLAHLVALRRAVPIAGLAAVLASLLRDQETWSAARNCPLPRNKSAGEPSFNLDRSWYNFDGLDTAAWSRSCGRNA